MSKQGLAVGSACVVLVGSAAATGEWLWTGFLVALVAILGIFEGIGVKLNGETLTNRFRAMKTGNKVTLTGGILSFIAWLMYHLWLE